MLTAMPSPKARHDTTTDVARFAAAVAAWRERSDLTLQQIAEELGTSVQNVSNWTRGKRPRQREFAVRLDEVLGAKGEVLRAYETEPSDLAARVAELEAQLARLTPQVAENSAELARGWDALSSLVEQVQHLDHVVRQLVDPAPPDSESLPGLEP